MSQIDLSSSVGVIVTQHPELSRVFEDLQIDYCCHGGISLNDACQQRQLDPQKVVEKLETHGVAAKENRDWSTASLTDLCDHIEATHHAFLRQELPRLEKMIEKVADAHADRHPELRSVGVAFQALQAELMPHMMKEEQILFPAIRQLEAATQPVSLPFGTVQNPIRMMEHEHDIAGTVLSQLHDLTGGYQIPKDACNTYRAMIDGLENLALDLHEHIHKENNILFPRSKVCEEKLG
jgi:regulator of cell morphogenesis and NO signaling